MAVVGEDDGSVFMVARRSLGSIRDMMAMALPPPWVGLSSGVMEKFGILKE